MSELESINDILSKLGAGKVTIPIKSNKYEETQYVSNVKDTSFFADVFDPIEKLRSSKGKNNIIDHHHDKDVTSSIKYVPKSKHESLLYSFACIADPTISLFNNENVTKKIVQIQNMMQKNFSIKCKEFGLKRLAYSEDDDVVLTFLSKVFDVNVLANNKLYTSHTEKSDVHVFSDVATHIIGLKECYNILCKDIEKKLAKEVKDISQSMNVATTYIAEDGKKKPLGKKELIDAVKSKLV